MPGNIPVSPETYRRLERLFSRLKHEQIESATGVVYGALAPLTQTGSGGSQFSPGAIPALIGDVNGRIDATVVVGLRGRDIDPGTPSIGDVLVWDGSTWAYVDQGTLAVILDINDLADVTIVSPISGQVLTYNGSAWVNDTPTASGQYRSFTWAIDGSLGWGFVEVDDGTGQMVPVTALFDLE